MATIILYLSLQSTQSQLAGPGSAGGTLAPPGVPATEARLPLGPPEPDVAAPSAEAPSVSEESRDSAVAAVGARDDFAAGRATDAPSPAAPFGALVAAPDRSSAPAKAAKAPRRGTSSSQQAVDAVTPARGKASRPFEESRSAQTSTADEEGPRASGASPLGNKAGPSGYLTVFTIPYSKVYLDDAFLGNTPIGKRSVPAGQHQLKMVNPDFSPQTIDITVTAGEVTRVRHQF